MRSISSGANNDIYLGAGGNLSISVDLQAVSENCKAAMEAQLGEMIYEAQRGIPTLSVVWDKLNLTQFEAYARRTLRAVDGVVNVLEFTAVPRGDVLTYNAVISTIYGQAVLNG